MKTFRQHLNEVRPLRHYSAKGSIKIDFEIPIIVQATEDPNYTKVLLQWDEAIRQRIQEEIRENIKDAIEDQTPLRLSRYPGSSHLINLPLEWTLKDSEHTRNES